MVTLCDDEAVLSAALNVKDVGEADREDVFQPPPPFVTGGGPVPFASAHCLIGHVASLVPA